MANDPTRDHLKNTARGIVVHDGKILLMERWRARLHYFSIPGGGIEPGETPEQTVEREIMEETSVAVRVKQQVMEMHDGDQTHKIYLCQYLDGQPHLPPDAPEAVHGPKNRFKPGWFALEQLPQLPFIYWQPLQRPLVAGLANSFVGPLKIVSRRPAR